MKKIIDEIKPILFIKVLILSFFTLSKISFAVEPELASQAASEVQSDLMTHEEMQKGLQNMQSKMNQRIEDWGNKLSRKDFERIDGKIQLKRNKQIEVCGIFQDVINETYDSAQTNKNRLSEADQKIVQDRNEFIKALGFKDNLVRTQMGFDCRMR